MTGSCESRLLDQFLGEPYVGRTDGASYSAPRGATYRAVWEVSLREARWLWALLRLRSLPRRFLADRRDMDLRGNRGVLDTFVLHGFILLAEIPNREVLLGGIGRFWHLWDHLPVDTLRSAEDFSAFSEPGFVKAAFHIVVLEEDEGSGITSEIRMAGTDPDSDRIFRRYWRTIGWASGALRRSVLRAVGRRLSG